MIVDTINTVTCWKGVENEMLVGGYSSLDDGASGLYQSADCSAVGAT